MAPTYSIQRFDPDSRALRNGVSELHAALLPHSPVALLGPRFMTNFYYQNLMRDELILGMVALIDKRPAGFMIATADANGFMMAGIRRHGFRLAAVLLSGLIASPRRIASVWEALSIMRHMPPPEKEERIAELLSFGVLPEFRSPAFIRSTGIHIARDLLHETMKLLEAQGVDTVRSLVDEDNTAAKLFYHGAGWRPGRASVPGWKQPVVEFLWRREQP